MGSPSSSSGSDSLSLSLSLLSRLGPLCCIPLLPLLCWKCLSICLVSINDFGLRDAIDLWLNETRNWGRYTYDTSSPSCRAELNPEEGKRHKAIFSPRPSKFRWSALRVGVAVARAKKKVKKNSTGRLSCRYIHSPGFPNSRSIIHTCMHTTSSLLESFSRDFQILAFAGPSLCNSLSSVSFLFYQFSRALRP